MMMMMMMMMLLTYTAPNIDVTLKCGLGAVQGHVIAAAR